MEDKPSLALWCQRFGVTAAAVGIPCWLLLIATRSNAADGSPQIGTTQLVFGLGLSLAIYAGLIAVGLGAFALLTGRASAGAIALGSLLGLVAAALGMTNVLLQ